MQLVPRFLYFNLRLHQDTCFLTLHFHKYVVTLKSGAQFCKPCSAGISVKNILMIYYTIIYNILIIHLLLKSPNIYLILLSEISTRCMQPYGSGVVSLSPSSATSVPQSQHSSRFSHRKTRQKSIFISSYLLFLFTI